jgi:hypothetical protein
MILSVAPVWLVSDVVASCEERRDLFDFQIRSEVRTSSSSPA